MIPNDIRSKLGMLIPFSSFIFGVHSHPDFLLPTQGCSIKLYLIKIIGSFYLHRTFLLVDDINSEMIN